MKLLKLLPLNWLLWLAVRFSRTVMVKKTHQRRVFKELWQSIWIREGYANKDEPLPEIEAHYRLFDEYSVDFVLYFLNQPIGTIRLIRENTKVGLPVFNDFEITGTVQRPVVEATLLTLKPEWRMLRLLPALMLWRIAYQTAISWETNEVVMAADQRLFHLMKRMFGFRQIGPSKFYEGSDTVPAAANLKEGKDLLTTKNPTLLKFFTS